MSGNESFTNISKYVIKILASMFVFDLAAMASVKSTSINDNARDLKLPAGITAAIHRFSEHSRGLVSTTDEAEYQKRCSVLAHKYLVTSENTPTFATYKATQQSLNKFEFWGTLYKSAAKLFGELTMNLSAEKAGNRAFTQIMNLIRMTFPDNEPAIRGVEQTILEVMDLDSDFLSTAGCANKFEFVECSMKTIQTNRILCSSYAEYVAQCAHECAVMSTAVSGMRHSTDLSIRTMKALGLNDEQDSKRRKLNSGSSGNGNNYNNSGNGNNYGGNNNGGSGNGNNGHEDMVWDHRSGSYKKRKNGPAPSSIKDKVCMSHQHGSCHFGAKCRFRHELLETEAAYRAAAAELSDLPTRGGGTAPKQKWKDLPQHLLDTSADKSDTENAKNPSG
jgi:hypothetical protein